MFTFNVKAGRQKLNDAARFYHSGAAVTTVHCPLELP